MRVHPHPNVLRSLLARLEVTSSLTIIKSHSRDPHDNDNDDDDASMHPQST